MDLRPTYARNTGQLKITYIYIYIYIYPIYICIYPKVYFIWVPEVGTSRGHEPIIDPSCGAVIFSPDRAHRDLSASNLPGAIEWI